MKRSLLSLTGILVLGGILLVFNAISDRALSRFYVDLTDEGLYSLSPGTENILRDIQQPVTFRFFFSKTESTKFPGIKLYGQRILDLLREYERQSGGKVTLEVYDPRPDTEEEEWAQKYGITPLSLPTGEKLYMGLGAVNSVGEEDAIPVFDLGRQEFLEYDVSKLISSLARGKKIQVAVISSLDLNGSEQPPMPGRPPAPARQWVMMQQLSKLAEVKVLPDGVDWIDPKTDVLMILHPKSLPEQTLYAIDQYAVRGGSLIVAVDPFCATDQPKNDPNNPLAAMTADRSSNLKKILDPWGVKLVEKKVAADLNLATKVSTGQGRMPESFPVWMTFGGESGTVLRSNPITAQLENVMLAWSGVFESSEVEGIKKENLLKTTEAAMLYDEQAIKFGGDNPEQLLKDYKRGGQSHPVAVFAAGVVKSAFPGKPGAEQQKEQNMSSPNEHLAQGTTPAKLLAVADVDFLADHYSAFVHSLFGAQLVSLVNDNLILAANAVENLANDRNLIDLRSRGKFSRPFTKVEEKEAAAQEEWKQQEAVFEAQLNEANQRLSALQSGQQGGEGKKVFNAALLGEIKKLREQRAAAQRNLRDVRRRLREDVESLGTGVFLLNTFAVPLLLMVGAVLIALRKHQKPSSGQEQENGEIIEEAKV